MHRSGSTNEGRNKRKGERDLYKINTGDKREGKYRRDKMQQVRENNEREKKTGDKEDISRGKERGEKEQADRRRSRKRGSEMKTRLKVNTKWEEKMT